MTPEEEHRLLCVATDTLETAAAQLQSVATRATSGHLHQELARIEFAVRHALAAVQEMRRARGTLMTPDDDRILLSVYVADARAAYGLFETLATEELLRLQAAHELDLTQATAPESVAFGGGRLALIAAVLKARGIGR